MGRERLHRRVVFLGYLENCKNFIDIYTVGIKITHGYGKPLKNDTDIVNMFKEHEDVENINLYLAIDNTAQPVLFKLPEDNPSASIPRHPEVRHLRILGDHKTNEKVIVRGDVVNGSEKASIVQFFTSVHSNFEVANLQAISSRTFNKGFDIPVDAEGHYLVVKFTPMTEDGDYGEPRYIVTENKVEALAASAPLRANTSNVMLSASASSAAISSAPKGRASKTRTMGAATSSAPKGRAPKTRTMATGGLMMSWVGLNGKCPIMFDPSTWKGLDKFGVWFDSQIGIVTRDSCEPFHDNWSLVPKVQKDAIPQKLQDWFILDLDSDGGRIRSVIDRDARLKYNEWKSSLKTKFDKTGGSQDLDKVFRSRPDSVRSADHWEKCIERFMSEKFLKKSKAVSENRSKLPYNSCHGRVCYSQHRYRRGNPQQNELAPVIKTWVALHKPNVLNDRALQDIEALTDVETKATQAALATSASSASPSDASGDTTSAMLAVDEYAIMEEVFGSRRSRIRGIGPSFTHSSLRSSISSGAVPFHEHQRVVEQLQSEMEAMRSRQAQQEATQAQLLPFMAHLRKNMAETGIVLPPILEVARTNDHQDSSAATHMI